VGSTWSLAAHVRKLGVEVGRLPPCWRFGLVLGAGSALGSCGRSDVSFVVYRALELEVLVARVFISHATPDRVIAEEVLGWLLAAGHESFLAHDDREGVSGGEDWKQRLYRELREVDAVIGVVTRSFLSSEWCFAELGIADARGGGLIPLRVEVGGVPPRMRELQ